DVASIDFATGEVSRRAVCAAPRGIAFDQRPQAAAFSHTQGDRASGRQRGVLHVACAEGELVTLGVDGGEPLRRLRLAGEARDVVVTPAGLVISEFRSSVARTVRDDGTVSLSRDVDIVAGGHVQWRMIAAPHYPWAPQEQYADGVISVMERGQDL